MSTLRPLGWRSTGLLMQNGEKGYALLVVMVAFFIVAVGLLGIAQPMSVVMQREREDELIFRGEAYAEAIRAYQSEHGGAYPTKLDQLIKQGPSRKRYLRILYRNPMDPKGKWSLLAPGVTPPRGAALSGQLGTPSANPNSSQGGQQVQPRGTLGGIGQMPGANQPLPFRLDGQEGQPIVGVYAKVAKESFKEYRGKKSYDEWYFSPLIMQAGAAGGKVGPPMQKPGQGPQPPLGKP